MYQRVPMTGVRKGSVHMTDKIEELKNIKGNFGIKVNKKKGSV